MLFIAIFWGLVMLATCMLFGVVFNRFIKTTIFNNILVNGFMLMLLFSFPINILRNLLHINNITTILMLSIIHIIISLVGIYIIIKEGKYKDFYKSINKNKFLIFNVIFFIIVAIIVSDAYQKIILASAFDDYFYTKGFKSSAELYWHLTSGNSPTELFSGTFLIIMYPINFLANIDTDIFYKVSVVVFMGSVVVNIFADFIKKFSKRYNLFTFLLLVLIMSPLLVDGPVGDQITRIIFRLHFGSTMTSLFNLYFTYIIFLVLYKREKHERADYIFMLMFSFVTFFCLSPQQVYYGIIIGPVIFFDFIYVFFIDTRVPPKNKIISRSLFSPIMYVVSFFALNLMFHGSSNFKTDVEIKYFISFVYTPKFLLILLSIFTATILLWKRASVFFLIYFLIIPIIFNLSLKYKELFYKFIALDNKGLSGALDFSLHRIGSIFILFLAFYLIYLLVEEITNKIYFSIATIGFSLIMIKDFEGTTFGLIYNYINISIKHNYYNQTVLNGKSVEDNVLELKNIIKKIPIDKRYDDIVSPDSDGLLSNTFFNQNKNLVTKGYNIISKFLFFTLKQELESIDNPGSQEFKDMYSLLDYPKYVIFTNDSVTYINGKLDFYNESLVKLKKPELYVILKKALPYLNNNYKIIFNKQAPVWKDAPTIMIEKK